MTLLFVALLAFAGSFCQAITGFGGTILMMTLMPMLYEFNAAAGITSAVCCPIALLLMLRYRKAIRLRVLAIPLICYLISSTVAVQLAAGMDLSVLKVIFGVFLIALAAYSYFAPNFRVKNSIPVAILCGTFAGISGGFFSIGGPLLVLYFLAATQSREEYVANINVVFFVTNLWQSGVRAVNGILQPSMLLPIALGICGVLIGTLIGDKAASKINAELMKKLIYLFLALSGVISILETLLR